MSHAALLAATYCGEMEHAGGDAGSLGKHITRPHVADNVHEQATALL